MNKAPIGVFDSGVGGLTVWKRLKKKLPLEQIIYLADSGNCPYGPKTDEEIISLSVKCTEFLLAKGCKVIVVACNTATSAAISYLRDKYSVPFVGMEPAIKPAAHYSKTGAVGILATAGTLNGTLYKQTQQQFANHVTVHLQIGTGLVDLVEKGAINTPEAEALLRSYIEPMIKNNIDQLVLGCSHYPFFKPLLKKITGGNVRIVEPSKAIAQQTFRVLTLNSLLNTTLERYSDEFYTTGDVNDMQSFLNRVVKVVAEVNTLTQ